MSTGSVCDAGLIFECLPSKQKRCSNFFNHLRIHGGLKKFKSVKFKFKIYSLYKYFYQLAVVDAVSLILKCVPGEQKYCRFFFNLPRIHGGLKKIQTLDARQSSTLN